MDRNSRRAVGSVAGRSDQRSWARSGATRNEIPDAARMAPALTAALFTTLLYTTSPLAEHAMSAYDRRPERNRLLVTAVCDVRSELFEGGHVGQRHRAVAVLLHDDVNE